MPRRPSVTNNKNKKARDTSVSIEASSTKTTTITGQASESNRERHWSKTEGLMLVFFVFVISLVLAFHIQNLGYIKNYQKESTDKMFPIFLLVNVCSIFGGGIAFGRPYSVMVVCVVGLLVLFCVNRTLPGLLDWTDKCLGIIAALLTNFEGLYIYIKYSLRSNDKGHIKYICSSISLLTILYLLTLYIFY